MHSYYISCYGKKSYRPTKTECYYFFRSCLQLRIYAHSYYIKYRAKCNMNQMKLGKQYLKNQYRYISINYFYDYLDCNIFLFAQQLRMLKKSFPFSTGATLSTKQEQNQIKQTYSQNQTNSKIIQLIISSNEQLIHEQMMKIRQLQKHNNQLEIKIKTIEAKYEKLTELAVYKNKPQWNSKFNQKNEAECRSVMNQKYIFIDINQIVEKIVQLQQKLSETKVEQAVKVTKLDIKKLPFHHEESSKRSRKTSVSQNSVEKVTLLFQSRTIQYNIQSHNRVDQQNQQIIANWDKIYDRYGTSQQKLRHFKEKSKNIIKKYIPNKLRTKIWSVCLQNKLGITSKLYTQLQERRQKGWVNQKVKNQIDKDIKRSFSAKTHRKITPRNILEVVELLQIFHIFRPDMGYVQGMTYPALVLIPIVSKSHAFNLLCNLILGNTFFRKLFCMQDNYLTTVCRAFENLLQSSIPSLANRFKQLGIHAEIYLIQWLFSMFSRGLTIEITLKFWDHLLYYEQTTIFKMALGIFQQLGPIILQLNFEQTLNLLKDYGINIQQGKLLHYLSSSKLTRQKMQKYFNQVKA